MGKVSWTSLALLMATFPAVSSGSTSSNLIIATVPIICRAQQHQIWSAEGSREAQIQLMEYCNAPTGFVVHVVYGQGKLRGSTLRLGDQQIVLSGSGNDEVMRSDRPSMRSFDVSARLKDRALDPCLLSFEIDPL